MHFTTLFLFDPKTLPEIGIPHLCLYDILNLGTFYLVVENIADSTFKHDY
jgi:hypothetical protein